MKTIILLAVGCLASLALADPAASASNPNGADRTADSVTEREPVSEVRFTATSAQGAADVVQTYFALLEAGHDAAAVLLWSKSDAQRARRSIRAFGCLPSRCRVLVGAPGRIEGAAGSAYVTVPITLQRRQIGRSHLSRHGVVTLRRSNGVPGAAPDQRKWRIIEVELR